MFLPENRKRLTNVCVVSLKKFGRRYEVAVYPNKLYEYRNGITPAITDIVHTDQIFSSVSKGKLKGNLRRCMPGTVFADVQQAAQ